MSDPLALYSNFLTTLRAGDDAATLKLFDPGFVIHEDPGMPYGGEIGGGENFLKLYRKVYDVWGENCLELLAKAGDPEGGRAFGFFRLTGCPAGATAPVESYVTLVWTFRNDLAVEARVFYYDTPRLSRALG